MSLIDRVASAYLASYDIFSLPADLSPKSIEAWLSGIRLEVDHEPSKVHEAVKALGYAVFMLKSKPASKAKVQTELDRMKAKAKDS